MMNLNVPFNDLSRFARTHEAALNEIAQRVIRSGRYVLGREVSDFETRLADWLGTSHAVGVNSGTDALALGLRALGVGNGDEVLTVGFTATPTVAAIRMAGGVPVFVDIDATYTMDPNDLVRRITPRTKAIIPVHLYGFPADMPSILAIAKDRGVAVLEDAAQAHGATIQGRRVGSFGNASAFSFYPTKNLGGLGDGGAVVTSDEIIAERLRRLRMYGEEERYASVEEGVNSRLDELQAAFLSYMLAQLEARNARRADISRRYRAAIQNRALELPNQEYAGRDGVWHLFVIAVDDRDNFMAHMHARGIGTAIHYPQPVYRQTAYDFLHVDPGEYPVTERYSSRIVSLPLYPELSDSEVEAVIDAANAYLPA